MHLTWPDTKEMRSTTMLCPFSSKQKQAASIFLPHTLQSSSVLWVLIMNPVQAPPRFTGLPLTQQLSWSCSFWLSAGLMTYNRWRFKHRGLYKCCAITWQKVLVPCTSELTHHFPAAFRWIQFVKLNICRSWNMHCCSSFSCFETLINLDSTWP